MRERERPTGKVKAVAVKNRRAENIVAVYATIICEDEAGKRWMFDAASFNFYLRPVEENQEGVVEGQPVMGPPLY